MLVYPQLATGASAQYPAGKRQVRRTVANRGPGGMSIRYADAGAQSIEWDLNYSGLVDEEAAALENFFREAGGRLRGFTFPDPLGNLLEWSEDFGQPAWQADPLITLTGEQSDPFGSSRAFRVANGGGAAQGLRQTLGVPIDRTYCFSVYAKAISSMQVMLVRGPERRSFDVGTSWSRLAMAGRGEGADASVTFGIEIGAEVELQLFGAQVEPQPGASLYKRTTSQGGVYANARFRDDELQIIAEGMNRHSCRVQITYAKHI